MSHPVTLASGKHVAGYEILGRLGAGGMGEVYRARDMRLGREVALKVLPADIAADPDRRARFEREARAASLLNHPNIVTIHGMDADGDRAFIVMERVEGRTLRDIVREGPVPLPSLLSWAVQVADGLARAHESGIVHRDLKPENVMVTGDGQVKILDFGLAKLSPTAEPTPDMETAALPDGATEPGVVMGTLGYMSPEQATGRSVDHHADQFAFGAILYEMATGRRAFVRPTVAESLAAILRDEPEPMTRLNPAAAALAPIVARCLAKDPARRYASTRELARELRNVGARPSTSPRRWATPAILAAAGLALVIVAGLRPTAREDAVGAGAPSLAVMPFQLVGTVADDDYLADGLTDAVTTEVARAPGLLVIARDTAFRYKGLLPDPARLATELGVRYVLSGTVQRAGPRLRVSAQLVDSNGYHVWGERYDRDASDLFGIQDDIGRSVASALKVVLAGRAPARTPTSNAEAYDAYLRGLSFTHRYGWDEKDRSIPFLERAVELDPRFALAHAELAQQYARRGFARDPDREFESKAFVALEKALALDPTLPGPYITRGNLLLTLASGFQYERAISDYRRALQLDPNSAAHMALGSAYTHVGLLDRALAEFHAALRTSPGDPEVLFRIARIHLYRGEHEDALGILRGNGEIERNWQVPLALQGLGRLDEARRLGEERRALPGMFKEDDAAAYAVVLASVGESRAAEEQIAFAVQRGEGSSHFHHAMHAIGIAYALTGKKADAVKWLRRAAAEGLPCYPAFASDRNLAALRGDAGFEAFLAEQKALWERRNAEL